MSGKRAHDGDSEVSQQASKKQHPLPSAEDDGASVASTGPGALSPKDPANCVAIEKARKTTRPTLSLEMAHGLAIGVFGLQSCELEAMKFLDSYDDQNVFVKGALPHTDPDFMRDFVLKVHNGVDSANESFVSAQNAVFKHLHRFGFATPLPTPLDGSSALIAFEEVPGDKGMQRHAVRLLSYVPGALLDDVEPSTDLYRHVGAYVASVDTALLSFDHPGVHRAHLWDLQHLPLLRSFLTHIDDDQRRALVAGVLDEFETSVAPVLHMLRSSVIQGDANSRNLLVDPDRNAVTGIIDFGDMVYSKLVMEVAVMIAYAILGKGKQRMAIAKAIFEGYHSQLPLYMRERALLRTLVAGRLAQSVTLSAYSFAQNPANTYLLADAIPAWEGLDWVVNSGEWEDL